MELSVTDRLVLMDILPKQDHFLTYKIIRKLRDDLSFSEEELKQFEFKEESLPNGATQVKWNTTVPQMKEVPIGEKATDIIVDTLKKLDESSKIGDREFPLYEKFVNGKGD